mmetsp:Transcript_95600/g.270516  ORF Transcript_95600/g.270516 Transcript_95600/m.270516 type:complete len:289 (+) Transcript_95600:106-972(+)|eukprot:CAMPEP_0117503844 /NCGR_PEP_ID=MMETSP0784-20121206/24544_1 /TAXON_ID=39447 /ORGANISM="" /LENGTH=288 /DNA_ID=CAMNT_0005299183 /DNA_START=34 /DNA_END=900 /DNA_ORIENTATION=+
MAKFLRSSVLSVLPAQVHGTCCDEGSSPRSQATKKPGDASGPKHREADCGAVAHSASTAARGPDSSLTSSEQREADCDAAAISTSTATRSPDSCLTPSGQSEASTDWQSAVGSPTSANDADAILKQRAACIEQDSRDAGIIDDFLELSGCPDLRSDARAILARALRFQRSCGYPLEDICVILAHASVYFVDVVKQCGKMPDMEAAYIVVVLMYMAHSYVQDENCPLRVWHSYLFRNYCDLHLLNKALVSMMRMRGFILRVDEDTILATQEHMLTRARGPALEPVMAAS